jgi:hypothetical protein
VSYCARKFLHPTCFREAAMCLGIGRFSTHERSMLDVGPLSAATARASRAGLHWARPAFSLTSRAVSSKATETPSNSRARPDSGVLEGGLA